MNENNEIVEKFKQEVSESVKNEVGKDIEGAKNEFSKSLDEKMSQTFDAIKSLAESQKQTNEQIVSLSKKRSLKMDINDENVDNDSDQPVDKKSFLRELLNIDENNRLTKGSCGNNPINTKNIFTLSNVINTNLSQKSYNTYNSQNGGYLMRYPNFMGFRDINRISIPSLMDISSVDSGGNYDSYWSTLDASALSMDKTQEGTSVSDSKEIDNGEVVISAKQYSSSVPVSHKMMLADRLGYLVSGNMLDRHFMYLNKQLLRQVNNEGIDNLIKAADSSLIASEDTLETGKFTYDDIWNLSDKIKNDYLGNATLFILKSAFSELLKFKGTDGQYTAFAGHLPSFDPAGNMVLVGNGCRITVVTVDSFAGSSLGESATDTCAFFGDFREAYQFMTYNDAETVIFLNDELRTKNRYNILKTVFFGQGLVNKEALIRVKIKS